MIYLKREIWGDKMAKKKSKTQKMKKIQKTKQKKGQNRIIEQTEALKKIKQSGAVTAPKTQKAIKTPIKKTKNGDKKKLVDKEKVKYNVAYNKENNYNNKNKKYTQNKNKPKNTKVRIEIKDKVLKSAPNKELEPKELVLKETEKIELPKEKEPVESTIDYLIPEIKTEPKKDFKNRIKAFFVALFAAIAVAIKKIVANIKDASKTYKKNKAQKQAKKELKKILNQKQEETIVITEDKEELGQEIDEDELRKRKETEKKEKIKKKNIFIRLIYEILSNRHIFFNAVLILFFIVLLIGLTRIEVISKGTIFYVSIISIFLMAVAISYNRYLSGKLFTIILCAIMGFAIYRIQYTYDFIRNLNSTIYEYKTYYVVTFNNTQNKSIYNINNKKVGLYKENTINIERKLDTKLDNISYIEYDDLNDLFNDFYNQKFRAILVNDNQYKYMKNHINSNSRDVKILYEFKANAKK